MNDNKQSGGISFCGLLTIAFIVLKLTGYITWSWWWVLAPTWIPLALLAAAFLLGGLVIGLRFVWLLFKGLWEDLNDHN